MSVRAKKPGDSEEHGIFIVSEGATVYYMDFDKVFEENRWHDADLIGAVVEEVGDSVGGLMKLDSTDDEETYYVLNRMAFGSNAKDWDTHDYADFDEIDVQMNPNHDLVILTEREGVGGSAVSACCVDKERLVDYLFEPDEEEAALYATWRHIRYMADIGVAFAIFPFSEETSDQQIFVFPFCYLINCQSLSLSPS